MALFLTQPIHALFGKTMNKFFHVDISQQLRPGMSIALGRERISEFGRKCWKHFKCIGLHEIPTLNSLPSSVSLLDSFAYRELYLEIFRTGHPEVINLKTVSRLNAFFAVQSIKDAQRYIERSNFSKNLPIYEIHTCDAGYKVDSTWLDQQFPRDLKAFNYYYKEYWKRSTIESDPHLSHHEKRGSLIEVLIASDVVIGELVSRHSI
ncbi:hypothetical protein [Variovorax atrisoli]|uniref:hypothetical protein n=1 Tax=Variovorax atrisoli TaxID=3394203 RepID=UPI0012FD1B4A|nr:hypothetical protein [Variovorax paradoxus]